MGLLSYETLIRYCLIYAELTMGDGTVILSLRSWTKTLE